MAQKIKVIWTKGRGDKHGPYMYDLTGRKQDQYKRAKWGWLKKFVRSYTQSNKPTLLIKVMVWDVGGKAAHDRFGQEFTPDSLAGAKNYAKKLVQDGIASMAEVVGWLSQPYGRYSNGTIANEFGQFEVQTMREAKDLSPEIEKKIDKIEADIKSGKISDKEGRKKIGDLMAAASKVSEAIIDAHLAGESVSDVIEKVSAYNPRWGGNYPYVPTSNNTEYPDHNEPHVADGHEAEADEYMATGEKR